MHGHSLSRLVGFIINVDACDCIHFLCNLHVKLCISNICGYNQQINFDVAISYIDFWVICLENKWQMCQCCSVRSPCVVWLLVHFQCYWCSYLMNLMNHSCFFLCCSLIRQLLVHWLCNLNSTMTNVHWIRVRQYVQWDPWCYAIFLFDFEIPAWCFFCCICLSVLLSMRNRSAPSTAHSFI